LAGPPDDKTNPVNKNSVGCDTTKPGIKLRGSYPLLESESGEDKWVKFQG